MVAEPPIQFPVLEGIHPAGPDEGPNKPACKDCIFFQPDPQNPKDGNCHGEPPTVIFTPKGPGAIRPRVNARDTACHLFTMFKG